MIHNALININKLNLILKCYLSKNKRCKWIMVKTTLDLLWLLKHYEYWISVKIFLFLLSFCQQHTSQTLQKWCDDGISFSITMGQAWFCLCRLHWCVIFLFFFCTFKWLKSQRQNPLLSPGKNAQYHHIVISKIVSGAFLLKW